MTRRIITPPPQLSSIVLRIMPDGKLYNTQGQLLCELQPGEMVKLNNANAEYTIIVHRKPNRRPAKVLRLVR